MFRWDHGERVGRGLGDGGERVGRGWGEGGERVGIVERRGWGEGGERVGRGWGEGGERVGRGWAEGGERVGRAGGNKMHFLLRRKKGNLHQDSGLISCEQHTLFTCRCLGEGLVGSEGLVGGERG